MCGIAGIMRIYPAGTAVPPADASIPEAWLDVLDEAIKHRGPDGAGRFRDRATAADGSTVDIAFVHRRLSILDHAGGAQPMVAGSGADLTAIVFNGCIYNHRALRAELIAAGERFESDHSDTEVLLRGWKLWGLGTVTYADLCETRAGGVCSRLDGMFAFAVWDAKNAMLTLGRDQHGEKPLYHTTRWTLNGGTVYAFASSAKGLLEWCGRVMPQRMPPKAAGEWIRDGYHTELAPISELSPGWTLRLGPGSDWHDRSVEELPTDDGPVLMRSYAEFEPAGSISNDSEKASPTWSRTRTLGVDELDQLLDQAVRSRLEADVPLGCFLSGGVDSSLVAWYAQRARGRIQTFTVKMPDAAYDESAFAETAARAIGSEHSTLECDARPAEDLVELISTLGLPFGDSSLLPTYWVSRAARAHVKVALSGDGGDELFAGYDRYLAAPILSRFASLLRFLPLQLLLAGKPRSRGSKLNRLVDAARGRGYPDLRAIYSESQDRALGIPNSSLGVRSLLRDLSEPRDLSISRAIDSDCREYLPGDLMRKTDTASMMVALEVRAPFLANEVTAAGRSATIASLMPGGERKGLLKAVARKYLPASIVDRPKQGFAIPIGEWFRSDFGGMKTLLLDSLSGPDPFPESVLGFKLNRRFVDRMITEHMERRVDHSQRLYMLLVLRLWLNSLNA